MVKSRGSRSPTKDGGLKGMDIIIKRTETKSPFRNKDLARVIVRTTNLEQDGAMKQRQRWNR